MKEKYYFDKFPIIESDRLILKEINPSEAENIIEFTVYDGVFAKTAEDVLMILDGISQRVLTKLGFKEVANGGTDLKFEIAKI